VNVMTLCSVMSCSSVGTYTSFSEELVSTNIEVT